MAKLYALSEKDRKAVAETVRRSQGGFRRRRPTQKRRRHPGGGGGSAKVSGAVALIRATVPAATIDEANEQATPGIKDADETTKAGALLMKWNDDGTGYVADTDLGADGWVDAVNLAMTDFRASVAAPMLVTGTYQKFTATVDSVEVQLERFVIDDKDLRSLPGYDKASAQAQVPYHDNAADNFQLGYDECA